MNPLLRSLLRTGLATVASLAMILSLAAIGITQPTFRALPATHRQKVDPERLRRHVELLTTETSPRDSDHPENGGASTATSSPRSDLTPDRSW